MLLRHLIRRHKWRLRPLKKIDLPLRNAKRAAALPRVAAFPTLFATRE